MSGSIPTDATTDTPIVAGKSIIVIGAGLVGAVQALLFARAGFNVTVVEKNQLRSEEFHSDAISSRTVALSHRSWQLLSNVGLWPAIDCCPIQTVHVSEQGNFGSVKLDARKLEVESLGFVISNGGFEGYLHSQLKSAAKVNVIESATVVSVANDQQSAVVTIEQSGERRKLSASLVVAADGTNSSVRELLGIDTNRRDYAQCAVLANVRTSQSLANVAFERFTRDGPLALLPVNVPGAAGNGQHYSMIYTASSSQSASLKELSDKDFLSLVQSKFGGRLGRFEDVGRRTIAELVLTVSKQQVQGRFVLIGNAARTLHPVAGQGMNLALQDVFELVSSLIENPDINAALIDFKKQRKRDQWWVTTQTDLLARVFTDKPWPLRLPVSLMTGTGFVLLDFIEPFKSSFAARYMGRHLPLNNVSPDSVM